MKFALKMKNHDRLVWQIARLPRLLDHAGKGKAPLRNATASAKHVSAACRSNNKVIQKGFEKKIESSTKSKGFEAKGSQWCLRTLALFMDDS